MKLSDKTDALYCICINTIKYVIIKETIIRVHRGRNFDLSFREAQKGNKGDFTYVEVYHFTGSGNHKFKVYFI